jgi:Tol biopolymer transport system component/DNA-binding winged helix-turn-helix (wHTH) protein
MDRETKNLYAFGPFRFDASESVLARDNQPIPLPPKVIELLSVLVENAGRLIEKDDLMKQVWPDTYVEEGNLNKNISILRKTLGQWDGGREYIETVPKRGYRFAAIVTQEVQKGTKPPAEETRAASNAQADVLTAFANACRSRRLWTAVALIVALFGGLLLWYTRRLPSPRLLNIVQITHDHVPKEDALTDGSRLYITETPSTNAVLVQSSVAGGETSSVPTPFGSIEVSDISPDHSRLLVSDLFTGNEMPFWSLPIAGGAPQRLGDIAGHFATWSPDGRRLAFSKGFEIYLANSDGNNIRKLATVPGLAESMRFSPDGTRLRFTLEDTGSNAESIWEIRTDGSNLHPLFPGWHTPPWECCGLWTPDGRYYLFASGNMNHKYSVWAVREAKGGFQRTSEPVRLTTTGPMSFHPLGFSADGKRLFAHGWLARGELVRYEHKSRSLMPYLPGISPGFGLDFSRDGRWIAYVSDSERTLSRSRIDGSELLQLTTSPITPFFPQWSPDGTQIAYLDTQNFKIFIVSADGGTPREMYAEDGKQVVASWSPDGRQIAFGGVPFRMRAGEEINIRTFDLTSKQVSTVPESDDLYWPRWSPDGRHLAALSIDDKRLLLFDFTTRKWKEWVKEIGDISLPNWSQDGKYIYYHYATKESVEYRRSHLGQTGSQVVVDLKNFPPAGVWSGLAPDGSPLFVRNVSTDEIYSLDLELP